MGFSLEQAEPAPDDVPVPGWTSSGARPVQPWQVTWDLENQDDVHLRLHSVPPAGVQVSLAKGKPAGGGNPYELQWVLQHNAGAEPLNSAFIEVLEAYEGQPIITAVRPVEVQATGPGTASPVAFQVVIGDGIESAVRLPFGGLYYRGKTLVNEDASVLWKLNGIENSRVYIHTASDPVDRETFAEQFTDRDGDGTAHFTVYDYGVGDTLTVPTIFSLDLARQPCDAAR
jgi:hypothetical protein